MSGPWRLNAGNSIEIMDARNRSIARAQCGGTTGIKLAEAEDHARLIAVAPEAVDALREVFADHDATGRLSWLDKVAGIITRATGPQ